MLSVSSKQARPLQARGPTNTKGATMCNSDKIHDGLVEAYVAGYRAAIDGCARYIRNISIMFEVKGVDSIEVEDITAIANYMLKDMNGVADMLENGQ